MTCAGDPRLSEFYHDSQSPNVPIEICIRILYFASYSLQFNNELPCTTVEFYQTLDLT